MNILKKSTSVIVHIGPFVDQTDGYSLETGLSPSSGQIELFKHEATAAVNIYDATFTHVANGIYRVTLTTAHTDTPGRLVIHAHITTASRPVRHEFTVVHADAYDFLTAGALVPSDVQALVGNTTAATLQVFAALAIKNFTVGTGATTTRIPTDLTESTSDHWNNRSVAMVNGALAGQVAQITDYNGATKELTVTGFTSAPAPGDEAVII